MAKETTFTFTFTGEKAAEIAKRFAAHFWDGGLDQYLEQDFFEQYGLSIDDFEFASMYHVLVNTDGATN